MRVINISSTHSDPWLRQFPDGVAEWDGWRFVFNIESREPYDYLFVLDDVHAPFVPRCPPENRIHVGTEPPLIRHYGRNFLSQFAWVITQLKDVKHPCAIFHQPAISWHLGTKTEKWAPSGVKPEGWMPSDEDIAAMMGFEALYDLFDQPKSKLMSIISSNLTVSASHKARLEFALKLKDHYGDRIDFYGRGIAPMEDKLVSLQEYRFHIALENSLFDHYFTEKLTDCIIAGTYPIYHGCPNLDLYFPKNSYIPIDIYNFEEAVAIIDDAIARDVDRQYRMALMHARHRVFYHHNLFPALIRLITAIERGKHGQPNPVTFYSREILPLEHEKLNI